MHMPADISGVLKGREVSSHSSEEFLEKYFFMAWFPNPKFWKPQSLVLGLAVKDIKSFAHQFFGAGVVRIRGFGNTGVGLKKPDCYLGRQVTGGRYDFFPAERIDALLLPPIIDTL